MHNSTGKALELLGVGSSTLRRLPMGADGGVDVASLSRAIAEDRVAGLLPFCVVGTAGSVDLGYFDDLNALADLCAEESLWFHVDGAFGAWARLAQAPWCDLVQGIERADSLAFDFHKWMFVQYDCGVALIRDEKIHRETFAARPRLSCETGSGVGWRRALVLRLRNGLVAGLPGAKGLVGVTCLWKRCPRPGDHAKLRVGRTNGHARRNQPRTSAILARAPQRLLL